MNDHITKPIDPDQLYATLARWLPSRRAGDPQVGATVDGGSGTASDLATFAPLAAWGIDVDRGLARYLNRKSFYLGVLRGFVSEYGAAVPKLQQLHAAGAREEIFRLAHTLKANADGIGASALADAARSVEDTARVALPDAAAIATLVGALQHVLEALGTMSPEPVEPQTAPAPGDMAAGLHELVRRLEDDDATSLDIARQLQGTARQTSHAGALDELVRLIEDLEYSQASAGARALLLELQESVA